MPNYPHLTNAPIVEAVIELRTRLTRPTDPDVFRSFRERVQPSYPKAQDIHRVQATFRALPDATPDDGLSRAQVGVRLDDIEGKWVIQGKSDGLTVSRLAPYSSWDDVVAVVRRLWPAYVETFKPEMVIRLGVRYVNLLPITSEPTTDLDTVLTAGPQIAAGLPQEMTEFMTRLVLPMPENGIVLTVVQASGLATVGANAGSHGVILDVDAACEQNFALNESAMWEKLEQLREAKNMAFFGSVTVDKMETFR